MNALDFAWRWPIVWILYGIGDLTSRLMPDTEGPVAMAMCDLYQWAMGRSHRLDKYEVCWVTYEPGEL